MKVLSATFDMVSKQIDNVTDPTAAQDAATKNYVDNRFDPTTDQTFSTTQTITRTDGITNVISNILILDHESTGTPVAGFGDAIRFQGKTDTTAAQHMANFEVTWTDPAQATRTSKFALRPQLSGALQIGLQIFGSGGMSMNSTTDPGVGQINASVGFKVANVALNFSHLAGIASVAQGGTGQSSAGAANYKVQSDGSIFTPFPTGLSEGSISSQTGFAADTYITDSLITVAAGDFKAGGWYRAKFHISKTALGSAAPNLIVRIGTAGSISDAAIITFGPLGAGSAVADTGWVEVLVNFRVIGASAVVAGVLMLFHNLTTTGLFNTGASTMLVGSLITSSTFNSTTATKIGLSWNGGTSASHTIGIVQAELNQA